MVLKEENMEALSLLCPNLKKIHMYGIGPPKNIFDYLNYSYVFYSVTKDVEGRLRQLERKFPKNIIIYTTKNRLTEKFMSDLFLSSRIYFGLSRSDGISTSFLESIQSGTYAIQSNTSCASEFTDKGIIADIIEPNYEAVSKSFLNTVNDDMKLDNAQRVNQEIFLDVLNKEMLVSNSRKFYDL
jgi:glycosyltransferase involved in cell wall biosynthesis